MNGIGESKLRFADGSQAMMQADEGCPCSCCFHPADDRSMTASMVRYNDRSSFANNMQQDTVVQLQSMFSVQAQKGLEESPSTDLVSMLAQLIALSQANT